MAAAGADWSSDENEGKLFHSIRIDLNTLSTGSGSDDEFRAADENVSDHDEEEPSEDEVCVCT